MTMGRRSPRIAVANWTRRKAGGAEAYLDRVAPLLHSAGATLAWVVETEGPADRPQIAAGAGETLACTATVGTAGALEALQDWKPDVVFVHGLDDAAFERGLLAFPTVFFGHTYYGTCISGGKTFTWPTPRPCTRQFGVGCIALYYPRRTGGLNPLQLMRLYRVQSARLDHLRRAAALVTLSEHMRTEFVAHGIAPERVVTLRPPPLPPVEASPVSPPAAPPYRLLFVGRLEFLKGCHVLIEALPEVAARIGPVELTVVGDGADRERCAGLVRRIAGAASTDVRFTGWLPPDHVADAMGQSHLLVLPSVWPEPFGLVGLEAAQHGLPTAAFATGGIPEWLQDGVSGHLAAADPPTSSGLASAIASCLADRAHYESLRAGAHTIASAVNAEAHVTQLLDVLHRARGNR